MEATLLVTVIIGCALIGAGAYCFWRYVWFFRNPDRVIPPGDNLVSPADGTVVYVKTIDPDEHVIVIKQGVSASVKDIVREDLSSTKLLIGIFMSPFDVHSTVRRLPAESNRSTIIPREARISTCTPCT